MDVDGRSHSREYPSESFFIRAVARCSTLPIIFVSVESQLDLVI